MAAGAYSSIFIATPFLAQLKERQPVMKSLRARVLARRKQGRVGADASASETVDLAAEDAALAAGVQAPTRADSGQRAQPRRQPRSKRKG